MKLSWCMYLLHTVTLQVEHFVYGHISKWYMIIRDSIVLSGTVDRNWCFDNAHENDDHLVVKTLVAVNNSPTQDYNVHSPDKSYSTLLKYYRQPKLSLAISCTWKCLSLSAIKDINLLRDLTFSLQKKNYVVLQKISSGFVKGSLLLSFLFIDSVNRHSYLKSNLT